MINLYPIIRSIASYFLPQSIMKRPGSGGSFSSKYCYSVWLRHLVQLSDAGLISNSSEIKRVAEIGPGDSLGIGIAALLSGAEEYYGFDVIEHANTEKNVSVCKEMATFFQDRLEIPYSGKAYQSTKPQLNDFRFPEKIVSMKVESISSRQKEIENALTQEEGSFIRYVVPWHKKELGIKGNIDLILSQAVMEHIDDIQHAYLEMYKWLKPGGMISHQIDYKAHEMTQQWNGHWYISDTMWKFLMKGRKYLINRFPHSAHVNAIQEAGFTIKNIVPFHLEDPFGGTLPKVTKCKYTTEDRTIASALIQAVKA